MSYFRRFRDAVLCVAFLVLPFLFLRANLQDPSEPGVVDGFFLRISAPLQWVATESAGAVSGVLEDYTYLVDVKAEAERLRVENVQLSEEARLLRLQAGENQRLRELLQLRERLQRETITAKVIGKEVSPFFRVVRLRLDRGQRDRVRSGMAVVSTEGLVGQIRNVFGRHADVTLTVDRESAVDVIIQRTGARGVLRGTGETNRYLCRIQYLQRGDEVEVGDELYTSGLGRRFPEAVLVGRVVRVERRDFGLYQEAEVAPSVDFSRLEEVLVLRSGAREDSVLRGLGRLDDDEEAP
ncbi:MAG: rod shape-determining protein MreC [Myxococcota bacterium]